jgi:hypothetical protein
MTSLIREALYDLLVVPAEIDEFRPDEVAAAAIVRSRFEPPYPNDGGKGRASEVEAQRAARTHVDGIRGLEQDTAEADVEQTDRRRRRHNAQFGIGDDGARDASPFGGGHVMHAPAQLQRSRHLLAASCLPNHGLLAPVLRRSGIILLKEA